MGTDRVCLTVTARTLGPLSYVSVSGTNQWRRGKGVQAAEPGAWLAEFKDQTVPAETKTMGTSSRGCASRGSARAVLEASASGKWTLIHGSDEAQIFDSFDDAAARAVESFGVGSYMIRTAGAATVTIPASVLFQRT